MSAGNLMNSSLTAVRRDLRRDCSSETFVHCPRVNCSCASKLPNVP